MSHLSEQDRCRIENLLNAGLSPLAIARKEKRAHSTIVRDVRILSSPPADFGYIPLSWFRPAPAGPVRFPILDAAVYLTILRLRPILPGSPGAGASEADPESLGRHG